MNAPKQRSLRLVRALALIAAIAILTGLLPAEAGAAIRDNRFSSSTYGFSVEWNDEIWVAEEITDGDHVEGVGLDSELTWSKIQAVTWSALDAEACVEYMGETFSEGDSSTHFRKASRTLQPPVSEIGGEGSLFTFTMGEDENALDMVSYMECAVVAGGTGALMVMLLSAREAYDYALPEWEELLAGVSVGEADPIEEEDVSGHQAGGAASYVNTDFGFAIEWNEEIWTGAGFDDDSGQGVEVESELSYGVIGAAPSDLDIEDCTGTLAAGLEASPDYKGVKRAPKNMERPETVDGAYAELYTMLDKSSPTKIAVYFECRELPVEDYLLTMRLIVFSTDYEDVLPEWQALIDGVSVGELDEDEGRDAPNGVERFSGNLFDFSVEYDTEIWTMTDFSDDEIDSVEFEAEFGRASLVAVEPSYDVAECIDALVENEQQWAIGEIKVAKRSLERPDSPRDAKGELFAYTLDAEEGPVDIVIHFECRIIGDDDGLLGITFYTTPDLYEEALPAVQDLLDSIDA